MYNLVITKSGKYNRYYITIIENKKVLVSYQFGDKKIKGKVPIECFPGWRVFSPYDKFNMQEKYWKILFTILVPEINKDVFLKIASMFAKFNQFSNVLRLALIKIGLKDTNYLEKKSFERL